VKGQSQRLTHRTVKPERDPVTQLGRRLATEGEDENATGVDTAVHHPVDDSLNDRCRLACARTGENQQWTAGVLDGATLGLIQARRRDRRRLLPHESIGRRRSSHRLHFSRRC
jgi:hypothetical protein